MTAASIHDEIAENVRGIAPGGVGALHLLARKIGFVRDVDRDLCLLKRPPPDHESDHVRNLAYNPRPAAAARGTSRPVLTTISIATPRGPNASTTRPPLATSASVPKGGCRAGGGRLP
jgi:hypothetical protein